MVIWDVTTHNVMKMGQQILPKYWYQSSILHGITSEIIKLCEVMYETVRVFILILISTFLIYQFLSFIVKLICRTVEIKSPPPGMD
jgi:hypothetical protein